MNEEAPNTTPARGPAPEYRTRYEERAERRAARAERRGGGAWVGAVILIVLGLVFLAQNLGVGTLNNWWALFILIPALGSFGTAWRTYKAEGLSSPAIGALVAGAILTLLTLIFLFNLNTGVAWNVIWPVLLIVGGGALLLQAMRSRT